jgi:ubiquinone/menaquinone biosynthesis C-methylase UbiE
MVNVANGLLERAFGRPRGLLGRLGGMLMERGNAEQESHAVHLAGLSPGERVLVVGHGPGVGLSYAASAVAPSGRVVGVDPSETMRRMAAARNADQIAAHVVEVRPGSAEHTGCDDASMDAAISVNNVMMWDADAGFAEMARVLRPGARLLVSVHRHVLGITPEELAERAGRAGLAPVELSVRPRRRNSTVVELLARRPAPPS